MRFEWDELKRQINLHKHGIDFARAVLVFEGNPFVYSSPRRKEQRSVAVGQVEGRVLAVVDTARVVEGELVTRIISARRARKNEEKRLSDTQQRRVTGGTSALPPSRLRKRELESRVAKIGLIGLA